MRTLVLFRHGEAPPGSSDFERPLSAAGRETVLQRAQELKALPAKPTLLLYSSAQRTSETAEIVGLELGIAERIRSQELYLAEATTIAEVVRRLGGSHVSIVVIGHNPGLERLASQLLSRKLRLSPGDYAVGTEN